MQMRHLQELTDSDLERAVQRLAACARRATADLIEHLVEFDARQLYLGAGYKSLFLYCREVLLLSEGESYNRIEACRAVRVFPVLLDAWPERKLRSRADAVMACLSRLPRRERRQHLRYFGRLRPPDR